MTSPGRGLLQDALSDNDSSEDHAFVPGSCQNVAFEDADADGDGATGLSHSSRRAAAIFGLAGIVLLVVVIHGAFDVSGAASSVDVGAAGAANQARAAGPAPVVSAVPDAAATERAASLGAGGPAVSLARWDSLGAPVAPLAAEEAAASRAASPSMLTPKAPSRQLEPCETIAPCEPESLCEPRQLRCWEAMKAAYSNGGVRRYDVYDGAGVWFPPTAIHQGDWPPESMQMMLYLHDADQGACTRPCLGPEALQQLEQANVEEEAPAFEVPRLVEPQTLEISRCPPKPTKPPPPEGVLDYNGIEWPAMCFEGEEEEHVFLIGDWGGKLPGVPAYNMHAGRGFAEGIDDQAQYLVARQFNIRARYKKPRYVMNVGDNFYWAGCEELCATRTIEESLTSFYSDHMGHIHVDSTRNCSHQFYAIFETMYMGPGIDGIPWISCLGNHDYGGFYYDSAWDQQLVYTWGPSGRWVLPALYYYQHVSYPSKNFTVDYYILDTNIGDVDRPTGPFSDPRHNICNRNNNIAKPGIKGSFNSNCAPFGPTSPEDCFQWFIDLWAEQIRWLTSMLAKSTADWQIIMTHFPPETNIHFSQLVVDLKSLGKRFGIDLIISGHRHVQALHEDGSSFIASTADIPYVITGGGGGITSEERPGREDEEHQMDQYGFMDMILTKTKITIEALNQDGISRGIMSVYPRAPNATNAVVGQPWATEETHWAFAQREKIVPPIFLRPRTPPHH